MIQYLSLPVEEFDELHKQIRVEKAKVRKLVIEIAELKKERDDRWVEQNDEYNQVVEQLAQEQAKRVQVELELAELAKQLEQAYDNASQYRRERDEYSKIIDEKIDSIGDLVIENERLKAQLADAEQDRDEYMRQYEAEVNERWQREGEEDA